MSMENNEAEVNDFDDYLCQDHPGSPSGASRINVA